MPEQTPAVEIRAATPADIPLILGFVRELAEFERAASEVSAREADFQRALFDDDARASAAICEREGEALGFALYFFNFSTWKGRYGLFLEDLYVAPRYRGQGAGKALLQHLAGIALANDCARFEWNVLDWNRSAIDFYESFGAVAQSEWIGYRLSGKALRDFATGAQESG